MSFLWCWRSRMRVNRQIEQNKKNGTNFHVGLLLDGGGERRTPTWAERIVGDFRHHEAALDCRSGGSRRQRIRRESPESLFVLLLAAAWAVLRTVLHRKCSRGQGWCSCYHGHRPRHKQHKQLQALHVQWRVLSFRMLNQLIDMHRFFARANFECTTIFALD